jgi:hypothetical protein
MAMLGPGLITARHPTRKRVSHPAINVVTEAPPRSSRTARPITAATSLGYRALSDQTADRQFVTGTASVDDLARSRRPLREALADRTSSRIIGGSWQLLLALLK